MENKKEEKGKEKIKNNSGWTWVMSILAIVLSSFTLVTTMCCRLSWNIETISSMLIGGLATIVVVGNYAQVYNIKKEFQEKIKENKKEFQDKIQKNDEKFQEKIDEVKERLKEAEDLKKDYIDLLLSGARENTQREINYLERKLYEYAINELFLTIIALLALKKSIDLRNNKIIKMAVCVGARTYKCRLENEAKQEKKVGRMRYESWEQTIGKLLEIDKEDEELMKAADCLLKIIHEKFEPEPKS